MHLESSDPISPPCARTVEPAVDALLRLGLTQEEVLDHLSRVLGIVRGVLDYQLPIPRTRLLQLSRSLWKTIAEIPGLGRAILIAESNIHHVPAFAARLYVIERGEIVYAGRPEDVRHDRAVMRVIGGAA